MAWNGLRIKTACLKSYDLPKQIYLKNQKLAKAKNAELFGRKMVAKFKQKMV